MTEKIMIGYADAVLGTNEIREATIEEIKEISEMQELAASERAIIEADKAAKVEAKINLLTKLGINEDEALLLL